MSAVIRAALLRTASWLSAEDEAGCALVGDLEELSAEWRESRGEAAATFFLFVELVRSVPALVGAALAESGVARLAFRSLPALLGGAVCFTVLVGVFGAIPSRSFIGVLAAFAAVLLFGAAAGWVTAALAGDAPRQHALALGVALAIAGYAFVPSGRSPSPLGPWVMFMVLCVVPAAAFGGGLRARSRGAGAGSRPASP